MYLKKDSFSVEKMDLITSIKNKCANWIDDSYSSSAFVASPSGRFIWNGGSVIGHNIDMNPIAKSEMSELWFLPFLNLSHLDEV